MSVRVQARGCAFEAYVSRNVGGKVGEGEIDAASDSIITE